MSRFHGILLLCAALPLLACGDPPGKAGEAKTVRAVVYQLWVVESGLEMIHGGGQWIREVHLADAGISFNVENDRLNCFVTEAGRYDAKAGAADGHAARRLGEIDVDESLVAKLQQLLKLRDEARDAAKACFAAAPPLEK